jgi:nucleoside-diphosphate-sugar epimerase
MLRNGVLTSPSSTYDVHTMKTLVTGGTGFTGSHLVRRLLDQGHDVTILDLQRGPCSDELENKGARLILGSVTDAELVDQAVADSEIVYHLAAAFRQISASKDFYWHVNVDGTRNVLNAAKSHGVRRVVHCSTAGVHGQIKNHPWDEDSPIAPKDLYQQTKWAGEQVCHEFMKRGQEITIIRPTSEYGPGDVHGMRFVYRLVKTGRFLMFGDGKATTHPVYIDNLIDAFDLATSAPAAAGRTYLIGDAAPISLNELVAAAARSIDVDVNIIHLPLYPPLWLFAACVEFAYKPFRVSPPLFRARVHWFRNTRAYSIKRARMEIGYEPRVSLNEGMRRTADWYRETGYL